MATKLGSTKRFEARYGRRLREKIATIELDYKGKKKCPYCNTINLKRKAVGIWECGKCKHKFTGRAYSPARTVIKEEQDGNV